MKKQKGGGYGKAALSSSHGGKRTRRGHNGCVSDARWLDQGTVAAQGGPDRGDDARVAGRGHYSGVRLLGRGAVEGQRPSLGAALLGQGGRGGSQAEAQ